jgi:hypothetical protein
MKAWHAFTFITGRELCESDALTSDTQNLITLLGPSMILDNLGARAANQQLVGREQQGDTD